MYSLYHNTLVFEIIMFTMFLDFDLHFKERLTSHDLVTNFQNGLFSCHGDLHTKYRVHIPKLLHIYKHIQNAQAQVQSALHRFL